MALKDMEPTSPASRRHSGPLTLGQGEASCWGSRAGTISSALRHYDEIGLLRPAHVDPDTGYRRYHPGQARRAGLIWATW
jgi:hypothetical protein